MKTTILDSKVTPEYLEIFAALQPKSEQPITKQVAALESRHHKIVMLLKHILATLTLEGNQHLFDQMPEDWHLLVKSWYAQYQKLVVKPSKEGVDPPQSGPCH